MTLSLKVGYNHAIEPERFIRDVVTPEEPIKTEDLITHSNSHQSQSHHGEGLFVRNFEKKMNQERMSFELTESGRDIKTPATTLKADRHCNSQQSYA